MLSDVISIINKQTRNEIEEEWVREGEYFGTCTLYDERFEGGVWFQFAW